MKNTSWSSLKQSSERNQRLGFLFPLCLFLIFASIVPFAYGTAEQKFIFVLFSVITEATSWIVLIVYVRKTCQLSDALVEEGERFLPRLGAEIDRLNKGPSSLAFQRFLRRCGI